MYVQPEKFNDWWLIQILDNQWEITIDQAQGIHMVRVAKTENLQGGNS